MTRAEKIAEWNGFAYSPFNTLNAEDQEKVLACGDEFGALDKLRYEMDNKYYLQREEE